MAALAMRDHAFGENLYAVHHAAEIDTEDAVPIVEIRVIDGAAATDAGIVAEHVDLAEDALGLVRRTLNIGAVADINLDEMDRVGALELLTHFIEMGLIDVGDDDLHAGFQKGPRHAVTDAARATGDESDLSFELLHARPF